MDFLSDILLSDERKVKILSVLDECSSMVLLSFAATSIKARKLVKLLQELINQKGKPAYIRCDYGPEFISHVLEKFAQQNGIEIRLSQPGKPTQNGLVERLNGTQREECLNLKYFNTVQEVEVQRDLDMWWNSCNFDRPHSALAYLTPQQFIDKIKISTLIWLRLRGAAHMLWGFLGLVFQLYRFDKPVFCPIVCSDYVTNKTSFGFFSGFNF